jgi:hypothetical protein
MNVVRKPSDLMLAEIARRLKRSYSWVYQHLEKLDLDQCYRYKGALFVRESGFRALEKMSASGPKRGRPRKSS